MGYTGTIVVGWSDGLLVHADGVERFGHRHRYLRPLGDGWQLLETGRWGPEPDLRAPADHLAKSTGRPVFAAHVFDSDFALLCPATGDREASVIRLHDAGDARPPRDEDVAGSLLEWSAAAGLTAEPARLREAVAADGPADDTVFALVQALGVREIGRTMPRSFPIEGWPFSTASSLAYRAWSLAATREADAEPGPPARWEVEALALDAEQWAAAYRPRPGAASFARRAIDLWTDYQAARGKPDETRASDLDELDAALAAGGFGPEPEIPVDQGRKWADRRASGESRDRARHLGP